MAWYIVRRLLLLIPMLIGITLITFVLVQLIPGDVLELMVDPKNPEMDPLTIAAIKAKWGLDQPVHVQYFRFLSNAARGDLGYSYRFNRPVTITVLERVPATLQLTAAAMLIAVVMGVTLGTISAVKHRTYLDSGTMVFALLGVSAPVFWLGLMFMYLFGVKWRILPPSGYGSWRHLLLPAFAMGLGSAAVLARLTRSSLLNVIRSEYVNTARSKGLSEHLVIVRHALRNALIPVVTMMGAQTGAMLAGAVVTETVFGWPGVGRLLLDSITHRDLPVMQGCVIFIACVFVFVNLVVDILYAVIDPRIRY